MTTASFIQVSTDGLLGVEWVECFTVCNFTYMKYYCWQDCWNNIKFFTKERISLINISPKETIRRPLQTILCMNYANVEGRRRRRRRSQYHCRACCRGKGKQSEGNEEEVEEEEEDIVCLLIEDDGG